ncbi:N-acyl-phosphatidylethanolamine-hydrolyzing phospholipase D [Tolypocladium ophioglossoides CBS 100239]|uniref:N-acyl-phosphatidylethanolamine-hydrolyzing phospholipase D n=1 Tax=Tolypocladium ophioglossoides (strain CBS 100239) TaxID=1163406 RepID=A0A0L0MYQ0_TOLOC|nr:N-acyl-phosphatidylethanolamine-hydrolyzing phospholipase D [Tolypocladium ophioglossoides CBS 100239]
MAPADLNVAVTAAANSPAPEGAADKVHHTKNGKKIFHNPWPSWHELDPEAVKAHLKQRKWTSTWTHPSTAEAQIPILTPSFSADRLGGDASNVRATWLGHACYFVEFPSGLRVLFDPVMTDRCSPSQWFGPRRFTKLPCEIMDIPVLDAVVISHNHYDHLSHPTVMEIQKVHPKAHFFVPLGNESWFHASGIYNVTELDWWEGADLVVSPDDKQQEKTGTISARITCLPAQHTTGRAPWGTDKTLWGSWSVASPSPSSSSASTTSSSTTGAGNTASVYFGGDTGYRAVPTLDAQDGDWDEKYVDLPVCPAFAQIGQLYGPFTLGLLPIGAYEPRALMAPIHANPRDAVEIFKDTGCKRALAMHWGTWVLGDEDVREPPQRLKEALAFRGISKTGVFDICGVGETVSIPL